VVPLQIFSLFGITVAIGSVLLYFAVMIRRIALGAPLDALSTF